MLGALISKNKNVFFIYFFNQKRDTEKCVRNKKQHKKESNESNGR